MNPYSAHERYMRKLDRMEAEHREVLTAVKREKRRKTSKRRVRPNNPAQTPEGQRPGGCL